MMDIDKLMQDLADLKRPYDALGKREYFPVIDREHLKDVEMVIRQFMLDNHDNELGVLQAKVFVYEHIIANSNFAPMISKAKEERCGEVKE